MRSPTIEASRWVGRVLRDKWRIDARIARGGVGTVFAATHKNNGSTVAIKLLHPEYSRDNDTRSRFLQEGYAANRVNHPGVVRILDDDVTEEGLAFLVMELLEGELLEKRRVRKGGRLPLAEVYEVADQLLDVVAAAHDQGIVHRDIKPDNLFLTKEGRLKVLDFGFAQMKSGFRQEQTATGYLLGTPGFMSPEQAVGNRAMVDAQTDIWAVGATLFTLISGEPVHEGESAAEMLVASANFPARPLQSVVSRVPPRLAQIIDKALAFEKTDRWPNARAMQAALRAVPGRVAIAAGRFESGRRSVPDDAPATFDDNTLSEEFERIDSAELESQPSWQSDAERTVMAVSRGNEAPSSAITRPGANQVAASDEDRTVAALAPSRTGLPSLAEEGDLREGGTLVMTGSGNPHSGAHAARPPHPSQAQIHANMQSQAHMHASARASGHVPSLGQSHGQLHAQPPRVSTASPQAAMTSGAAMAPPRPPYASSYNAAPQAFAGEHGNDIMYGVAGAARPSAGQERGSRVLVFVAVAAISMIIVVVTGLLILLAAD